MAHVDIDQATAVLTVAGWTDIEPGSLRIDVMDWLAGLKGFPLAFYRTADGENCVVLREAVHGLKTSTAAGKAPWRAA